MIYLTAGASFLRGPGVFFWRGLLVSRRAVERGEHAFRVRACKYTATNAYVVALRDHVEDIFKGPFFRGERLNLLCRKQSVSRRRGKFRTLRLLCKHVEPEGYLFVFPVQQLARVFSGKLPPKHEWFTLYVQNREEDPRIAAIRSLPKEKRERVLAKIERRRGERYE